MPLWDVLLGVIAASLALVLIIGFGTGRAEYDIIEQFKQMNRLKPVTDWHPPVIVAVWRALYGATGSVGSLVAFLIILYFLGVLLWALFVHRRLGSRLGSLAVFAVSISPWAYSQLNTPWKDSIMAAALLVGAAAAALYRPATRGSWMWVVAAVLMLVFAALVRKNAIAAVVPICVFLGWRLTPSIKSLVRKRIPAEFPGRSALRASAKPLVAGFLMVVVGGASIAADAGIGKALHVRPTHQSAQIILDDVIFSVPQSEINSSDVSPKLKERIDKARQKCTEMGERYDAYWNCFGKGVGGSYEPLSADVREDLTQLWKEHVITHPRRYLSYRWSVYEFYLNSSVLVYLRKSIPLAQAYGFDSGSEDFNKMSARYVLRYHWGGALGGVLFKPWFWLASAVVVGIAGVWCRRSRGAVLMLTSSAAVYIVAYFPVIPSNHFRYTYWSALAVSFAAVLVVVDVARRLIKLREQPSGQQKVKST